MAANVTTCDEGRNEYYVSCYQYKKKIPALNKGDSITKEQYKHCELSEYFEIDRLNVYRNGQPNPNHVFKLFGSYSSHSAAQVRVLTLQAIAANGGFTSPEALFVLV